MLTKTNMDRKEFVWLTRSCHSSYREVRAGTQKTWRQEPEQRGHGGMLLSGLLLKLVFVFLRTTCPRAGTSHINHKSRKCSPELPASQSGRGTFSVEATLWPYDLAYVKMTKILTNALAIRKEASQSVPAWFLHGL